MSEDNKTPSYRQIAQAAVNTTGTQEKTLRDVEKMLQQNYESQLIVEYALRIAARDSKTTIRVSLGKLNDYEDHLEAESLSLSDVSDSDVRSYTDKLAYKGRSIGTIDGKLGIIRGLHDFLEEEHGIEAPKITVEGADYAGRVPEPIERQAITKVMVRKLIQAADGVRNTLIVAMFYYTGMRRRELAQCDINDINRDKRVITINEGKGNKSRRVPFRNELDRLLQRWLEQIRPYKPGSESPALFIANRARSGSKRLSPTHCYKIVMDAAEKSGIQEVVAESSDGRNLYRIKPHVLRHSLATHMVEDGVPLRYIQRILGHESVETTLRYAKESDTAVFGSYHQEFNGL